MRNRIVTNNVNDTYKRIKKDYSVAAEKNIEQLFNQEKRNTIKSNQIRTLYALISPFFEKFNYGNVPNVNEAKKILRKTKIKLAYQVGRDSQMRNGNWNLGVKPFNDITNVLELIDIVLKSNDFIDDLKLYCDYFEALVAYHRYYETLREGRR